MVKARRYRIIHEPILCEYLVRTYPIGTWAVNVRVGPVSEELLALTPVPRYKRMMKIVVGSVDAIVKLPDKLILIECMVREEIGKIQQLKHYKMLVLSDPDFKYWWDKTIELHLLSVIWNPYIRAVCEREGIRYIYYRPPWVEEYLATLPARIRGPKYGGIGG